MGEGKPPRTVCPKSDYGEEEDGIFEGLAGRTAQAILASGLVVLMLKILR